MPRTNSHPKYRLHRPRGLAVVTLTDPSGKRKDCYLGKHGTAASRAEYDRVIAEWLKAGRKLPADDANPSGLSVNELILRFWTHAKSYYRHADGSPTPEVDAFRLSFRPLKKIHGHTPADSFGPLALEAVSAAMVGAGLSRPVINRRIGRIKRLFKWGVSKELVPPSVCHGLQAVQGLQIGRTAAPEPPPILPVADDTVERTIPHLPRHVRGIIQFMRLTGARPGEACQLRMTDIDTTGEVWRYKPSRHKGTWRGGSRVVFIGPRAKAIVNEFTTDNPEDFIFSPARARAERFASMRAARKTAVQPSQVSRARPNAKRRPGVRYTSRSLHRAIVTACEKGGIPTWHANQLRHSRGTEVRKAFGLEGAQVTLGHTKANTTEIYALRDEDLAVRVALETG